VNRRRIELAPKSHISPCAPPPKADSSAAPASEPPATAQALAKLWQASTLVRSWCGMDSKKVSSVASSHAAHAKPAKTCAKSSQRKSSETIHKALVGTVPIAPSHKSACTPCRSAKRPCSGVAANLAATAEATSAMYSR